jgi:hypothetical protein
LARVAIVFATTGLFVLVATPLAFFFAPAVGAPSAAAINWSIARHAGGSLLLGIDQCRERRPGLSLCDVPDSSNSGSATYRVQLDGRCYRARKVTTDSNEEGPYLPRVVNECVALRDQLRPLDRLVD